jgi:hypothetical protein
MSGFDRPPRRERLVRFATLSAVAVLIVISGTASTAASAPSPPAQASFAAVIPGPGFAAGWDRSGPLRTFTGQDLFNQIDGGAELFLEFGFVKLRLQTYSRGKSKLTLNAHEMEGPASALGVYLMKMGRETPFPEVAARNSSEEAQLTIVKGRYFIQVDNLDDIPASRAETVALANAFLAGVSEEKAPTPLDSLPAVGRVPGSERLIRGPYGLQPYFTFGEGDILSLGGRIFGALAEYRMPDGKTFARLMIPYPSPDTAAAALAHIKANLDSYLKVTNDRPDGLDFVDFQGKKGTVVRSGALIEARFKISE